ncbi:MAG: hypothetical protein K2N43_07720 [Lachnospiraceae bacterium]|nr:hypothetical protein [Lachnospiraceae bacterium]
MNKEYLTDKEFESLSEAEQLQYFNDLVKDIPHEDFKMLREALPEISKIQKNIECDT